MKNKSLFRGWFVALSWHVLLCVLSVSWTCSALGAFENPQPAQGQEAKIPSPTQDELSTSENEAESPSDEEEQGTEETTDGKPFLALEDELPIVKGIPGEKITVHLPLVMANPRDNAIIKDVVIRPVIPENHSKWPFGQQVANEERNLSELADGMRVEVLYEWKIENRASAGFYDVEFEAYYLLEQLDENAALVISEEKSRIALQIEIVADDDKGANTVALILDEENVAIQPPINAGEKLGVTLYLKNAGEETCSDIVIAPDLSSDLNEFPFQAEAEKLAKNLPALEGGERAEIVFDFTVDTHVTKGVKQVGFTAVYRANGKARESKFRIPIEISNGIAPTPTPSKTSSTQKEPRLIIRNYSIIPSKPVTGDAFILKLELKNEGEKAAHNLRTSFSCLYGSKQGRKNIISADEVDTIFLERLDAGEESIHEWTLKISEEADSASYALNVDVDYENDSGKLLKLSRIINIDVVRAVAIEMQVPKRLDNNYRVGDRASVEAIVENKGGKTVNSLSAHVEYQNAEGRAIEQDALKVGEKTTFTLPFEVQEPGEHPLHIILRYTDENGEKHEEKKETLLVALPNETEYDEDGYIVERDEKNGIIGKKDPTTGEWVEETERNDRRQIGMDILIGSLALAGSGVGLFLAMRKRAK